VIPAVLGKRIKIIPAIHGKLTSEGKVSDPDETDMELDALADVFEGIQHTGVDDDVILLGDLNVDEHHPGRLGQLPGIAYAISGVPTNTRRDKTYDNLVFDARTTVEFNGRSGVLDFMAEFGLTEEQSLLLAAPATQQGAANMRARCAQVAT